ncbi:MAG: hypothetical protein ACKO2G_08385 [Verrucomicrobiales bacterium]
MKYPTTTNLLGAALMASSSLIAAPDCASVAAAVETSVKADKSTVLAVVAAKIKEAPDCACDVVKSAIRATNASNELTGQIVESAVRAEPSQYKVIVECAVAVNSGAAAEIRAALQRVFGGKDGQSGKVVVPDVKKMSPALAIAFILDGITPIQGMALATGTSTLPAGVKMGSGSGPASGLRTTAAIPGGSTSPTFGVENSPPTTEPQRKPRFKPKPKPPSGGGGGGGTPTNPRVSS